MKNLTTSISSGATGLTIEAISSLYTNPVSSAVREVLSNALDAHTEAGVDTTDPVDVFIEPKNTSTRVVVTDHGAGMSPETVESSFLNVEVSNKRDNEKLIGGHGIGIFSVLAATPTVSVITTHGGTTTNIVGTNAGEGNLLWTVNTTPAGDNKPGTIVDMTVTIDPTTADFVRMYEYVVTAAFTRNVRVRERSPWLHAPLRNDYMNRFGSSNSIYTDPTGDTVFYPYGADKDPETMGYLDALHTIGSRHGVYIVPNICVSQRVTEGMGNFGITINGIPYEPHVAINAGTSCHTFVTEQWFNENTGESITKIPRSREYVELTNYPDITPLRVVLDHIYSNWADEERNDLARTTIDKALKDVKKMSGIMQQSFRSSLFHRRSVDAFIKKAFDIDIKKVKKSYGEVTEIENAVEGLILDTPDYLVRLLNEISARTPRATITCPHAATNSNVESVVNAVTDDCNKPLTLGMAMEVVAVLAAEHNYKTYGRNGRTQPAISKFSFLAVQDMPENPPSMLDRKQRTSLALFTGRKGITHVLHPEVDMETHALAITSASVASLIIGQKSTKFSEVLGRRWGNDHAHIHSSVALRITLDMMNRSINKAPGMTWKILTTSEKKKNTVRTWPFAHYIIDENGRCIYQGDTQVSAEQATEYDKDEHVLFTATTPSGWLDIPNLGADSSHRGYYRLCSPFDSMDKPFDENDSYQSDACYGRKVLHDSGVREMYVYHHGTNKTPSSAVYKLARTSWHKLWTQVAVPALNARNKEKQKKKYTPYVFERLVNFNGSVDMTQFPWIIYKALMRTEAKSRYALFGNYANPVYLDILDEIIHKLPDDVPERFVRPLHDETRTFTTYCYEINSITDTRVRGFLEEIAGDKGAATYDMICQLYLTTKLSNVMGFLASYSMSVQPQEVQDIIRRGNKELGRWWSNKADGAYTVRATIPPTSRTNYIADEEVKALRTNGDFEKMRKEYVAIAVPVIARVWEVFSNIVNLTYKEIGSSYTIKDYYEVVGKIEERVIAITAPMYSEEN